MSPEAPPGPPNATSSPPSAADRCFWGRVFWCFAALHLAVWLLLPALTQPNAPMDVVEIVYWGHEWQWGYFKHPPLTSWLAEAARVAAGTWGIYFLSQASILTAFWAVWRTAREMVGPRSAFFSVLLLECCPFYNLWTTEFNHGVCMCASLGRGHSLLLLGSGSRAGPLLGRYRLLAGPGAANQVQHGDFDTAHALPHGGGSAGPAALAKPRTLLDHARRGGRRGAQCLLGAGSRLPRCELRDEPHPERALPTRPRHRSAGSSFPGSWASSCRH